jgi:branched-chain amino acid transport system permease protein
MSEAALSAPARSGRALWSANALPIAIFVIFAVTPLFAVFSAESFVLSIVTRVMIFAIAALGLDLLIGYGALVSFGHAAFVGLGAYAVGIQSSHGISETLMALPVALAVSALFAFATGIVCLRTKGVYFIMITLAFGQMVYFIATSLAPYGGDDGLTIRVRSTLAGFPIFGNDRALLHRARVPARRLPALPRAGRIPLRAGLSRRARESAPRFDNRLRGLSLSACRLCDRRHARWA